MALPPLIAAPAAGRRHPWRRTAAFGLGGCLVRVAYIWLATDPPSLLVSDMRGYWQRAHLQLAGALTGSEGWAVWPPFYHVTLAGLLRLCQAAGLDPARWLDATLALHAALGGLAVGAVHVLARQVLRRPAMADGVAALYAVTFPIVYLEAFVLAENVAIPALVVGTACVLAARLRAPGLALGGALLGIAVAARPGLAMLVPAFVAYVVPPRRPAGRGLRPLAALGGGFLVVVGLVSVGNAWLSGGALRGLARNGGLNFFLTQCRVQRLDSLYDDHGRLTRYRIVPPQFADEPWRPWVATDQPPYAERYFYRRGLQCWRERPLTLLENVLELRKLVWGPFFPSVPGARGRTLLGPVFGILIAGATVVAGLAPLAWRDRARISPELWLLWGLLALTAVAAFFFGAERRFLLPVVFAAYVCAASVVVPSPPAPGGVEVPVAA